MARLAIRAAASGMPAAQVLHGHALRNGLGVQSDQAAAEALFRKAAEKGHALGRFMLGDMLIQGGAGPRRSAEAVRWLTLADGDGLVPMAAFQLGLLYAGDLDKGFGPDYPLAERWLRRAAATGQPAAAKRLVQLHESGLIVLADADLHQMLMQASDAGDGYSSWRLGQRLSGPDAAGRDIAQAVRRYELGVAQGFHLAAFHLALLHKEGKITGNPDLRAAIPWMERAAALGNPVAFLYLGQWHEFGERDGAGNILVPVDVEKARQSYEAAARKGAAAGTLYLGELYDTAAFGRRDRVAARREYERAAGFEKDPGTRAKALARLARLEREDALAAARAPIEASRGNPDATVQVIVYTELDRAACGTFYRDVLRPIVDKFVDRGLIRLVLRGLGRADQATSVEALLAVRCMSHENSMRVAERILEYQGQWAASPNARRELQRLIEPLGASPVQLARCAADQPGFARLLQDLAADHLRGLGVGQLPAVFVNGEMFEGPKLSDLELGIIRALPPQSRGPVWQR
jgi:TPR repeat protein